MKRFGNLYHRIYDIDNLYLAYSKAKRAKEKRMELFSLRKIWITTYFPCTKNCRKEAISLLNTRLSLYMTQRSVKYTGYHFVTVLCITL